MLQIISLIEFIFNLLKSKGVIPLFVLIIVFILLITWVVESFLDERLNL